MDIDFEEALDALIRFHEENPYVFDELGRFVGIRSWVQPDASMTRVTKRFVYLYNINGQLAKYNRRTHEIII